MQKSSSSTGDIKEVQLELTAFFQTSEQRAIQIATAGDSIRKITKNFYKVRSQSGIGWYNVKKLQDIDAWTCECADFMYKLSKNVEKKCKHILAVQKLQRTFEIESRIEPIQRPVLCPKCSSNEHVKCGYRMLRKGAKRQRYRCIKCRHRFIVREPGFTNTASSPQMISEGLNLILNGMSYRAAASHLSISHDVTITHTAILYWFKKYTQLMKEYVDTLIPEFSEVWSVDEMMLNVKGTKPTGIGFYDWMWSIISPQSKFVIASVISKKRETEDARVIFQHGKKIQRESNPVYVITDALQAYEGAFRQEFDQRRSVHIQTKSLSDGFANRPVERWHNELRQFTKTRRGLGNDKSAQVCADALRIFHDFCRPHSGLPNKITPAQAAGIDLKLGNNKIKSLIEKSAEAKERAKREYALEPQLGIRIEYVTIDHDKDCISVKPKSWIPKHIWREINDILFINGFSWLENGKESEWIKMLQGKGICE